MNHSDYFTLLNNPLWHKFRKEVLVKHNNRCDRCGSKISLQIHHNYYNKGQDPWEYKPEEVEVLCRRCHYKHHFGSKDNIKNPSDSMKHRMFIIKELSTEYNGLSINELRNRFKKVYPDNEIYEAINILKAQNVIYLSNGFISLAYFWIK